MNNVIMPIPIIIPNSSCEEKVERGFISIQKPFKDIKQKLEEVIQYCWGDKFYLYDNQINEEVENDYSWLNFPYFTISFFIILSCTIFCDRSSYYSEPNICNTIINFLYMKQFHNFEGMLQWYFIIGLSIFYLLIIPIIVNLVGKRFKYYTDEEVDDIYIDSSNSDRTIIQIEINNTHNYDLYEHIKKTFVTGKLKEK